MLCAKLCIQAALHDDAQARSAYVFCVPEGDHSMPACRNCAAPPPPPPPLSPLDGQCAAKTHPKVKLKVPPISLATTAGAKLVLMPKATTDTRLLMLLTMTTGCTRQSCRLSTSPACCWAAHLMPEHDLEEHGMPAGCRQAATRWQQLAGNLKHGGWPAVQADALHACEYMSTLSACGVSPSSPPSPKSIPKGSWSRTEQRKRQQPAARSCHAQRLEHEQQDSEGCSSAWRRLG